MTYAELIFELKRLQSLAEKIDMELAYDLNQVIHTYEPAKGECCG